MAEAAAGTGDFTAIGEKFREHLTTLCGLTPHDRMLDIGCGPGRIALPLTSFLSAEGSYEGFDIQPWVIDWCRNEITSRFPSFRFQAADVFNAEYNPEGLTPASSYSFPYRPDDFDVVLAASVFTHLMRDDAERYMREVARVLKKTGCALLTFYLVNEEASDLLRTTGGLDPTLRFEHDVGGGNRVSFEEAPEAAVAFEEELLLDLLKQAGLHVEAIHYGRWCGRADFLDWQDLIVARRLARHPTG